MITTNTMGAYDDMFLVRLTDTHEDPLGREIEFGYPEEIKHCPMGEPHDFIVALCDAKRQGHTVMGFDIQRCLSLVAMASTNDSPGKYWAELPSFDLRWSFKDQIRVAERDPPPGQPGPVFDFLLHPQDGLPTMAEILHQLGAKTDSPWCEAVNLLYDKSDGTSHSPPCLVPYHWLTEANVEEAFEVERRQAQKDADSRYRFDEKVRDKARSVEQGTNDWLNARMPVTASTIGSMVGQNPFCSPYDEMCSKINPVPSFSCAMDFGTFFEDTAQFVYEDWAASQFYEVRVTNMGTERFDKPFNMCSLSPDGLVTLKFEPGGPDCDGVLEYKCPARGKFLDAQGDLLKCSLLEKPEYYAQVQFEMHMLKRLFTHFVFCSFDVDSVQDISIPETTHGEAVVLKILQKYGLKDFKDERSEYLVANSFCARATENPSVFFVPFHHKMGALYRSCPLLFLVDARNQIVGHRLMQKAIVPSAFVQWNGLVGYEVRAGQDDESVIRTCLRNMPNQGPSADELEVQDALSTKSTLKYIQEFLELNGLPSKTKGETKASILARCRKVDRLRRKMPGVRQKVTGVITSYPYDAEYGQMLVDNVLGNWYPKFVNGRHAFASGKPKRPEQSLQHPQAPSKRSRSGCPGGSISVAATDGGDVANLADLGVDQI